MTPEFLDLPGTKQPSHPVEQDGGQELGARQHCVPVGAEDARQVGAGATVDGQTEREDTLQAGFGDGPVGVLDPVSAGAHIYAEYGFLDSFNPSFTYDIELKRGRVIPGFGWVSASTRHRYWRDDTVEQGIAPEGD